MIFEKRSYTTLFGVIEYCYFEKLDDYPNGLLVEMGSLIETKYRGQGHYKEMMRHLLSLFPEGTVFQIPICNKRIVPMFERIGMKRVDKIEFWGSPSNCVLLEGILGKEDLDLM